jgi:hypothetical protein
LVGEALALSVTARRYAARLNCAGCPAALIDGLGPRAHALAEAQAELSALRGRKRSEAEVALEAVATELRGEMIADGRFALRNDPGAQKILDDIQEGEGLEALIQDLKDVAAFSEKYADTLHKIRIDPVAKAARARKIAGELGDYVAARRSGDTEEAAALDLRNRAATHLLVAVNEVRATGDYVFRKSPRIVVRFRSDRSAERRAR